VRPKSFDHIALWVSDRDGIARRLLELGLRVIERTDAFTLVGGEARSGKLTFFASDPPRDPGPLQHIGVRVPNPGREQLDLGDGLRLRLLQDEGTIDLDHVVLRVPDPEASARRWLGFGFSAAAPGEEGDPRVEVGGTYLELRRGGRAAAADRPLLNHLGVLVDSVEEHRADAEERGIEIENVVDAPNTVALFVHGPDGVRLEYIEHKPEFSLV
jgi:catechol 2,3-dioxygenase-like lactoylglutathione lyase family enzyme